MPTGKGAPKVKNTTGQASLDDQGETDSISSTKSEHRNIYYRLYTTEGPLDSNNPIFSNDRFISRISSKSVRPPHTAASLKKCFCKIEGMEISEKGALYLSLSERKPLDDSARLALRGNSGPGSSEVDPVIFVVDKGAAEKRMNFMSNAGSNELPAWSAEQHYVYYRCYDDASEAVSKMSFDESDSSLGRIDIFTMPPPHTVASLKKRLVHVEGVSGNDIQLLENEDGEVTLNDGDDITLLADDFPGSKEDQPIVFTYTRNEATAPEIPSLSKRLTARGNWAGAKLDAAWHTMKTGEIFHTDGVCVKKPYRNYDNLQACYVGINSSGKKAFVLSKYVTLSSKEETVPEIPSFSKRLTATNNWDGASLDAAWHSMVTGEIFQTDGVRKNKSLRSGSNRYDAPCYVGINSSGKKAFVPANYVTLS